MVIRANCPEMTDLGIFRDRIRQVRSRALGGREAIAWGNCAINDSSE